MSDNVIRSMFGMGKVSLMPNINGLLHVVAEKLEFSPILLERA